MSNQQGLQKIIKKGRRIDSPQNLLDSLFRQIADSYHESISRELHFLTLYYGLQGKSLTLESIGKEQEHPLTRERVRQIIDSVLTPLKQHLSDKYENPYIKSVTLFNEILGTERLFLRLDELVSHSFFSDFKKNTKGLIAFLNDCGVRQIAYRKSYYFYPSTLDRKEVIAQIQKENKIIRREKTLEKMSLKAKTVTYVPDEVREHLLKFAEKHDSNLNPLYENILTDFMKKKPYMKEDYVFSRTKSWKARKGKAQWQQIGIYIERDIFEQIKEDVKAIKNELHKNVSLMSFICQAFVWHYETKHK
jgi:hypothetical protein